MKTIQNDVSPYRVYTQRRQQLIDHIKKNYSADKGLIVLWSGFEHERGVFRQESSFYYLTGITEPGLLCIIDLEKTSTLYIPNYAIDRSLWIDETITLNQNNATLLGFDLITSLGDAYQGYQITPHAPQQTYKHALEHIKSYQYSVYSLMPDNAYEYTMQRFMCDKLLKPIRSIVDISEQVAEMRRIKQEEELRAIRKAIEITAEAQKAAAQTISPNAKESDVRAALESVMIRYHATPAFPSIVASGRNATILHYTSCNKSIGNNDLVIVDIGAEYDYYAADITRTYPTSGTFSPRQQELYQLVLDCQEYVAQHAQPGYWLKNAQEPDKSLHHLAVAFFKKHGYDQFFFHGIGHYLGLDVHDVGSYHKPLAPGNVITIEPGLYIREESIGIRIEDNYLITENGSICLSNAIPKTMHEIEQLMIKN